ncbi:MAG: hypothetical protein RL077_4315 [Verrucomicrobiota bacterium]|jgi:glycosyltransferase involved in cell wall biosynthesis
MMESKPRVLMVPDAYWGPDSGAVAARLAAGVWQSLGFEVAVYIEPPKDSITSVSGVRIYSARTIRLIHHFGGNGATALFIDALEDFQPTQVFFLGSAISKPTSFFAAARRRGIPRICLWWIQDFFCTRGYGCLPDEGPCTRCLNGNGLHAVFNRCHYNNSGFSKIIAGVVARMVQRRELQRSDVVMGSSLGQLDLYRRFGMPPGRLVQCPLFFDRDRVQGHASKRGDYFVCYGQAREEKGWHLLASVLRAAPGIKLVLPFGDAVTAELALTKFGLRQFQNSGQVQVIAGVTWPTGVARLVAESCGVLIPSLWPTTTEYVLLESIGLGKPVIAFDVGIHAEEIVSGENGLLAPVGDAVGIAGQLIRLASDFELQARLATGAKRLFERLTAPERYAVAFRQAIDLAGSGRQSEPMAR